MAIEFKGQRETIKFVRDRAKARYNKGMECRICGITESLDFHHYYSLTPLLNKWMTSNRKNPEDVIEWRDEFIGLHMDELYKHAVTLCHTHHLRLHSVYGKNPALGTALKQMRWVEIQREKTDVDSLQK